MLQGKSEYNKNNNSLTDISNIKPSKKCCQLNTNF